MNKSSFFIIGQHAVIEALRNPKRKVLRVFLTEESKKNIHRKSPKKNLLEDVKVYFKTKKELDKYSTKENLLHQGYVAEVEHLEKPILKDFIKEKKETTLVCLDGVTDPRNIGSLIRSAASFKIDGIIIKERHFPNESKLMYKAASGSIEYINIFEVSNINSTLKNLKNKNFWVYGFDGCGDKDFTDVELYPLRGRVSSSFNIMFAGRWKNYMEKTNINIFLDKFSSNEKNTNQCSGFNFILKK